MSLYAQFDNDDGGDVATNEGWREFCGWVAELTGSDRLRQLTEYGWSEELTGVASELTDALDSGQPSPSVAATGHGLLDKLRSNADAETLVVSDGMTDEPEIAQ